MFKDIDQLLEDYKAQGVIYSTIKAHQGYLEDFKKSKIAMLMKQAQSEGINTASGQEREAYAHDDYVALLKSIETATESESKERFLLRSLELEIEIWRTQQANERQERKLLGG